MAHSSQCCQRTRLRERFYIYHQNNICVSVSFLPLLLLLSCACMCVCVTRDHAQSREGKNEKIYNQKIKTSFKNTCFTSALSDLTSNMALLDAFLERRYVHCFCSCFFFVLFVQGGGAFTTSIRNSGTPSTHTLLRASTVNHFNHSSTNQRISFTSLMFWFYSLASRRCLHYCLYLPPGDLKQYKF